MSPPLSRMRPERLLGLDALRGLCALGVAVYHVSSWADLAHFHNLGLYGVYAFFVLSGVSMMVAYDQRLRSEGAYPRFIAHRYARILPLYALASIAAVAVTLPDGAPSRALLARTLLGLTMLFGFASPGETSVVTGGWSLGIEFVFYFTFPLMLGLARHRWFLGATLACMATQLLAVNLALAPAGGFAANWTRYTQFASFVGYFAAGVWIGGRHVTSAWRRTRGPFPWLGAGSLAVLLATQHGDSPTSCLVGLRGAVLTAATCGLVAIASTVHVPPFASRVAELLGDVSYPLYILHPIVYEVARRSFETSISAGGAFAIVAASCALGLVVHHAFERPVLARLRTLIDRRDARAASATPPHSEHE